MVKKRLMHPERNFEIVHVVLKASGKGHEKDKWMFDSYKRKELLEQMKRFLGLYGGITALSFCAMSSHLHVMLKIDHTFTRNRREMADAYFTCYGRKIHPNSSDCFQLQKDQSNLSKFMQRFARDFAINFNKECSFKRRGHLWAERFHSTQLEDAKALLRCWTYIVFNPVKAGMVSTPFDDEYNSITFEDKSWCEESLFELYEVYNEFTQNCHRLSFEKFKEVLMQILKDEIEKWKCLNKREREAWKENHHFWDRADAVGSIDSLEKVLADFKLKREPENSNEDTLYWF